MTDHDRIKQIAQEADAYADQYMRDNAHMRPDWIDVRDARFAALIAEDCAEVAYGKVAEGRAYEAHVAIRARYGVKGE
jgi:hypothetical protein